MLLLCRTTGLPRCTAVQSKTCQGMLAVPIHSGYNCNAVMCMLSFSSCTIINRSTRNYDIPSSNAPTDSDKAALRVITALIVTAMPHIVSHVLQELDSQDPVHKQFWDAMMVIAEVELQEALKQDELDWARLRGEPIPAKYTIKEAGLHESVDSDVQMMLAGRCCWAVVTQACLLRNPHLCTAGIASMCSASKFRWLETPILCSFSRLFIGSFGHVFVRSFIHAPMQCWYHAGTPNTVKQQHAGQLMQAGRAGFASLLCTSDNQVCERLRVLCNAWAVHEPDKLTSWQVQIVSVCIH